MIEFNKLLILSIVAALLELDVYYVGVFLIAQPIFLGAFAGYFLGDIKIGILLGSIVQLIWINNPPVGAFVPPSSSAIAFISTVFSLEMIKNNGNLNKEALLMFCLIIGITAGYFIGQTDIWHRKLNVKIIHLFENKIKECKEKYIYLIQILSLTIKFLKDFFIFIVIINGIFLAESIFISLPHQIIRGLKIAFWIMPIIGLAVIFNMMGTKDGMRLHGIIFLLSYLLFYLLKGNINILFFILIITLFGFSFAYVLIFKNKKATE